MKNRSLYILADVVDIYSGKRISRSAAALSYYFTMTFFPMLICLYYLLGANVSRAADALDIASRFISEETASLLADFLGHVARNKSPALLFAGLTVLITSSSASIRTLLASIGEMQGGVRFKGIMYFVFSIIFSFVFLAAMYFAVLVILSSRAMLNFVNKLLPIVDVSSSWVYLRYLILAGILFLIIWALYRLSKRSIDHYKSAPGAAAAAFSLVVMSAVFSKTIEFSTKYSMVYGSIASIILLMLWLYFSCQIIYVGAALNIAIRNEELADEKGMVTGGYIRINEIRDKYYEYRELISGVSRKYGKK